MKILTENELSNFTGENQAATCGMIAGIGTGAFTFGAMPLALGAGLAFLLFCTGPSQ